MGIFEPIPFYAITFIPMLVMEYGLFGVAPTLDMPAIPWEVWLFGESTASQEQYSNEKEFSAHDFAGEDNPPPTE